MTPDRQALGVDELAELERLAEKATPGPWWHARSITDRSIATLHREGDGYAPPRLIPAQGPQGVADAAYIAAADPATVTALIAAARLGLAWEAAEGVLPEPGSLSLSGPFGTTIYGPYDDHYNVSAWSHGERVRMEIGGVLYPIEGAHGPTPAAALWALVAALREPSA